MSSLLCGACPLLLCLGLLAGALANDSDAEVASFFSDEVETRRLDALRAACGDLCNTSGTRSKVEPNERV